MAKDFEELKEKNSQELQEFKKRIKKDCNQILLEKSGLISATFSMDGEKKRFRRYYSDINHCLKDLSEIFSDRRI